MTVIKSTGIIYLSDLTDMNKLKSLSNILIKAYDHIRYCDMRLNFNGIHNIWERTELLEGSNTSFWTNYVKKSTYSQIHRRKTKYKLLLDKYAKYDFIKVRERMIQKMFYLMKY